MLEPFHDGDALFCSKLFTERDLQSRSLCSIGPRLAFQCTDTLESRSWLACSSYLEIQRDQILGNPRPKTDRFSPETMTARTLKE